MFGPGLKQKNLLLFQRHQNLIFLWEIHFLWDVLLTILNEGGGYTFVKSSQKKKKKSKTLLFPTFRIIFILNNLTSLIHFKTKVLKKISTYTTVWLLTAFVLFSKLIDLYFKDNSNNFGEFILNLAEKKAWFWNLTKLVLN